MDLSGSERSHLVLSDVLNVKLASDDHTFIIQVTPCFPFSALSVKLTGASCSIARGARPLCVQRGPSFSVCSCP